MRVNQIQQPAPVEQVQNTAPTDGSFKFMLASHVEEAELQERLTNLMAEITTEGEKLGLDVGGIIYEILRSAVFDNRGGGDFGGGPTIRPPKFSFPIK